MDVETEEGLARRYSMHFRVKAGTALTYLLLLFVMLSELLKYRDGYRDTDGEIDD